MPKRTFHHLKIYNTRQQILMLFYFLVKFVIMVRFW